METELKRVQTGAPFPKVSLTAPTGSGYVLLAAEVDSRLPFLPSSRAKRRLMEECKRYCAELEQLEEVKEAVTFRAALIPPAGVSF